MATDVSMQSNVPASESRGDEDYDPYDSYDDEHPRGAQAEKDNTVETLILKLQILKKALLKEQEERTLWQEEAYRARDEVANVIRSMEARVGDIIDREVARARARWEEEEAARERTTAESHERAMASLNSRLSEVQAAHTAEMSLANGRILVLERDVSEAQALARSLQLPPQPPKPKVQTASVQTEALPSEAEVAAEHARVLLRLSEVEGELTGLRGAMEAVMIQKSQRDVENELLSRRLLTTQEELKGTSAELRESKKRVSSLAAELAEATDTTEKMAAKLVELKARLGDLELQLRKFSVKRINRFVRNTDAVILLHKNPSNGIISLEVSEGGRHRSFPLSSIRDVQADPSGLPNRFLIIYSATDMDLFESNERDEIVATIQEFMNVFHKNSSGGASSSVVDDLSSFLGDI